MRLSADGARRSAPVFGSTSLSSFSDLSRTKPVLTQARRAPQVHSFGWALAAAVTLAACGGANDSGSFDLSKGVGGMLGDGKMKALTAGTAAQGGVLINEVHAANWKGDRDEDGDAEDWVELYNPSGAEVDLSGYGLSANTASPFRWAFPAGQKIGPRGYLRVWLSKKNRTALGQPLHASFNLDNGADTLYLSASTASATGILIDSTKPALVKPDHSWCRMPSGQVGSPFQICATPTPGAANAGRAFPTMLAKPVFSISSGLFAGAQTVSLTGPTGATIRFTTDGSLPTEASPAYTGPISVTRSQVLRAASFSASASSSPTESQSYVIDAALAQRYADLKTVFVVMEPADLARYQARDEALAAQVHVEMMSGQTRLFKQDADGSVAGNLGSVNSPQVALNASAKDVFGPKDFVSAGVLWPSKPSITKSKKLRLRNGGNDWDQARLRDALAQDLASAGPNIIGASTPVLMFMNGNFYGHMNLREREDETSVANNMGADKDFVDFLENPPGLQIKNGGIDALNGYRRSLEFITGNDMSVPANFERAKREVDVTSLAWDWGHHLLMANYDWPHNNVYVYRSPELGNRWTWRPHDFDFAFGRYAGPEVNMSGSFSAVNSQMFMSLIRNPEFRDLFFNVAADQMNLMTPAFMNSRLDAMTAEMRPYINDTFVANSLGGEAAWNSQLAAVRTWMKLREPFHDQHLRDQFNLGNRGAIGVAINDRTMGTVKVNTLDVGAQMGATHAWSGKYYPGFPVTLEAKPKPGFVFLGWRGASTATSRTINHTIPSTTALPADGFAVRWSGQLVVPTSGNYRFQIIADDEIALNINGQLLAENYAPRAETTVNTAAITLSAGQRHNITVQYVDFSGAAKMRLLWLPPGASEYVPVPASQFYPDAAAPYPTGLFGAYFNNTSFAGEPTATAIEHVDFAWGTQGPTASRAQFEAVFAAGPAPAAPTIVAVPPQSARTGDLVTLALSASDANGHALRFTASGLPKGISLNPTSGIIFGRLTTPGSYSTVVTVTNGVSSATLPISWTVTDRVGTGALGTSADSGSPDAVNTPPVVALTSPSPGQTVTAGSAVVLAANASDAGGSVSKVEFFDGTSLIGSASSAPFTVSWSSTAAGSHSLTARATDNLGATATSAAVTVTVRAVAVNQLPTVALVTPVNGQIVANAATLSLSAAASDPDGSIARVDFYEGSKLIGSRSASPYALTTSRTTPGRYVFSARAVDNQGASAASSEITVTVASAGTTPLPAGATTCASEGGFCTLPSGATATVYFGVGNHYFFKTGLSGVVACSSAGFGDPVLASGRSCSYVVTGVTGVLKAEYWANRSFTGSPAVTRQELPALNLQSGQAPASQLPSSGFAVRWTGSLTPTVTGSHRIAMRASLGDGVRIWVNGVLLVDTWSLPRTSGEGRIDLVAGRAVPIRVEFYDTAAEAQLALSWRLPNTLSYSAIPAARFNSATPR